MSNGIIFAPCRELSARGPVHAWIYFLWDVLPSCGHLWYSLCKIIVSNKCILSQAN